MKKIINNLLYDTDTAKHIGSWKTGRVIYTLYRKRTGEYFTCYNGKIFPLTVEQGEKTKTAHGIKLPDCGNRKKAVTLSLPAKLYEDLRDAAARENKTISGFVEMVLKIKIWGNPMCPSPLRNPEIREKAQKNEGE